jgi:transposase InsO family protein
LHTDNGTEFANSLLEEECRRWGTYIIHGRPYHPQSQGVVERANASLKRAMHKYQRSHATHTDWVFVLSQVLWWQNSQVHSVTHMSPIEHFQKFNHFSRQVRPIGPNDNVVISVAQLATIPALQWVEPREVTQYDEPEEKLVLDEEEEKEEEEKEKEQEEVKVSTPKRDSTEPASASSSSAHATATSPTV